MAKLYHFSNFVFELNKFYISKNNKPYFGDYEKLYEKYRPKSANSRKNSFFLTPQKDFADQFGEYGYHMENIGKTNKCSLFWNSVLQDYCSQQKLVKGFKKDYGYLLSPLNVEQEKFIKKIVKNYFNGVMPIKSDYKKFEIKPDAENNKVEVLVKKVKVTKILK